LPPTAPLDPLNLAGLLSVLVLPIEGLPGLPTQVSQRLLNQYEDYWSAITVTDGGNHLIVTNPSHAATRRNSSIAHELAHIILGHEPSMMFLSPKSGIAIRTHNAEQEDEADWLAGALLLPREALLEIRRGRLSDEDACAGYGVSRAMFRFRVNITGVDAQVGRTRRRVR
jgi:Zn-dependent peptidase ImmA (M78 family)